ncbi:uncharacterized protein MELLADRAFT_113853 [Melampsora larici-populina 98AG31]|uniref:F-box domain-containing protein n=1 Tax=Melampsora larici-populina (strain 98AG31 / pathotype 3-4-7) TaxID=747676 RepID=F4SB89_MELLP|nr:uncharacterized protein MELLADRAFT_113853 [Melampsora larici-populina 98AG31]EGF98106.1 hypothetical protein MELLADRAFT_113853 [Melampsora larici-populina 98AG31]
MPTSSRSAQLGLWREIVWRRHVEAQPVNRHLEFIQQRFDELDSEGFVWSKESILGIFLQLGLPDSPHAPFSRVNMILESRVLPGIELSSEEVTDAIQIEEWRHKSRPLSLVDLPIELFDKILEKLDCIARLEAKEVYEKKKEHIVAITGPGERTPYLTYLHRNSPILNSIQTLSLTSREIYQRCQPWLWRKLQFPTSLPAPIELWTEDILIRQGPHTRSLSLGLSENCSRPPGEFVYHDSSYDNVIPGLHHDNRVACISPKNVRDLIDQCPNISTLVMDYEYFEQSEDAGTEAFLLDLIPLLSSLKYLRHFKVGERDNETTMIEFPSRLVANLPLLESLTCEGFTSPRDQRKSGDDSFGFNLSKLKFLSRLHLLGFDDIDEEWCLYDWPRTITDLAIGECGNLSPSSAHRIIHHIAPFLHKLELTFAHQRGTHPQELDPTWNPQTSFSLPLLTDLELFTWNTKLLDSFQDCISISCFKWTYITPEHCRSLNRIICEAAWPQVRTLTLVPYLYLRRSTRLACLFMAHVLITNHSSASTFEDLKDCE